MQPFPDASVAVAEVLPLHARDQVVAKIKSVWHDDRPLFDDSETVAAFLHDVIGTMPKEGNDTVARVARYVATYTRVPYPYAEQLVTGSYIVCRVHPIEPFGLAVSAALWARGFVYAREHALAAL